MTASAGAWYRVGTVNVTKNIQTVTGVATNWQNDVIAIAVGDIFTLDAKTWYEVTAVASDTSITLDRGFEGATGAGQSYAIVRNTSGTILTRIAGQVSVQFNQKQLFLDELRTWLNSNSASETLTDSHGITQSLKTPSQMVRDHDNRLAELDSIQPYPWAMRKVEFEANRKQNNEMFAASGFVHFGKHMETSGYKPVNQGLYYVEGIVNAVRLGRSESGTGQSKTSNAVVNMAGVVTEIDQLSKVGGFGSDIKLPPAEDGTRTYDSSTGVSVTHTTPAIAFASETATNKVVTDRVDMWGFEAYLREVNDADPFVYANGLIQSLATDINGVATDEDNARPITYFAWYEGDTESRGRGVNWQTASEAQRIKIASDPENNIYFDDTTGKFYQWCIRGRSFAGAGNGDWRALDSSSPNTTADSYLRYSDKNKASIQGNNSEISQPIGGTIYYSSFKSVYNNAANKSDFGLWIANKGSTQFSANDECYLLLGGTVNRLNKGAYHPSFNPSGTDLFQDNQGNVTAGRRWFEDRAPSIASTLETFSKKGSISGLSWGGIATNISGRPDGRFHDSIYGSGSGGICRDMRYSAWGLKTEDFNIADLKVRGGEYRGREFLTFSRAGISDSAEYNSAWNSFNHMGLKVNVGDRVHVEVTNNVFKCKEVIQLSDTQIFFFPSETGSVSRIQNLRFVIESKTNISISEEYTHVDVIGDPVNILQCDDLKAGWLGNWLPVIPDGENKFYALTRKCLTKNLDVTSTSNNGQSWNNTVGQFIDVKLNGRRASYLTAEIAIYQYKTKAGMTKDNANSAIYDGEVKGVFASHLPQGRYGSLLGFSLIGKALTGDADQGFGSYAVTSYTIDPNMGSLFAISNYWPKHPHIDLASVSGPAYKALNYSVVENQQGFINYAYTELKHNGTDWGDDGKIHIVDNQSTMLDTNGNTVKVGTARIVEPLGWIKNDK